MHALDYVDYGHKNKSMLHLYWILVIAVMLMELLDPVLFLLGIIDLPGGLWQYMQDFFISSESVNIGCGIATSIFYHLFNRSRPRLVSYVLMASFSAMFHMVVQTHYYVNIIFMAYPLLLFFSLVYNNKRLTLALTLVSLLSYFCFLFFVLPTKPTGSYQLNYVNIVASFAVILASFLVCLRIFDSYGELIQKIIDITVKKATLERALELDSLTGLFNHAMFYNLLDESIEKYQSESKPFTLAVIDIDNFKKANDIYGHRFGDHVILRLVEIIRAHLSTGSTAHRYGGEEFTILFPYPLEKALATVERIRADFEAEQFVYEDETRFTISIGLCQFGPEIPDGKTLFSIADGALYDAKRTGKNKVLVANTENM